MNHFKIIFLKNSSYFHWSIVLVCISSLSFLPSANFGLSLFFLLVPWGIKIGCLSDLIVGLYFFNFPLSTVLLALLYYFLLCILFFFSFTLNIQTIDSDMSLNYGDAHIKLVPSLLFRNKDRHSCTQVMRGKQVIKNNRMWKNKQTKQKPGARFVGTQRSTFLWLLCPWGHLDPHPPPLLPRPQLRLQVSLRGHSLILSSRQISPQEAL